MRIQVEIFSDDIVEEMQSMVVDHLSEVGPFGYPLEINWPFYINMYDNILLVTMRKSDELIGYAIYIISHHLHFSSTVFAKQDSMYIKPEYRGAGEGTKLMEYSEAALCHKGVDVIVQSTLPALDFGGLLEHNGYKLMETCYSKNIGSAA